MIVVRSTTPQDSTALLRLAGAEPLFSPDENAAVEELLSDYFGRPDHRGYFFLTAEADGQLIGFACYGPTPLTEGTYDLYWICVDAAARGRGIGRELMAQVEDRVREAGGRMIVLDTSGRPDYATTRAFYERLGYRRTATVPDFYAPGDDLVIYSRRLR